jgi:uncharacterized damage-inducible protein DinB
MTNRWSLALLICAALVALPRAQTRSKLPNPISTVLKGQYDGVIELVVRAAEKMPEANYGFKPTPEVRSFGQLVGHVAENNLLLCSAALGENPPPAVADTQSEKTSKTDLQHALDVAISYCGRAYQFADEQLAEVVPERRVAVRLQPLIYNAGHNYEHYGNMVTYMRMKGLVPPSSERPEIERRLQGQPKQ